MPSEQSKLLGRPKRIRSLSAGSSPKTSSFSSPSPSTSTSPNLPIPRSPPTFPKHNLSSSPRPSGPYPRSRSPYSRNNIPPSPKPTYSRSNSEARQSRFPTVTSSKSNSNSSSTAVPSPAAMTPPLPVPDYGAVSEAGPPVPHKLSAPLKDSISKARLIIICAGIWSSNFAFAFQSTAIPTLAPTIASDFNHAELASYLGSVFTLGNTAGIPVYGVLIDTLGRRFAMITACTFFGVGSILCALAPGMWWLIGARGIAGLGGGGLLTVSAVICTDLVHLRERGFYQGIMMTIFGLGSMIGGPLSGHLSDVYDWRISFWIQVPIIIWCATIVTLFVPDPPIAPTHDSPLSGLASLDWGGSILLLSSVASLILGLSFHTSYFRPWSDPQVWGLLLASIVGVITFILVERKVKRPIVPPSMFRSKQLVAIWTSGTLLSISSQAFLFHVPTYFSVLLNSSGATAGMVVSVCSGIGLSTGSLYAGHHIRKGGNYTKLGIYSLLPSIFAAFIASTWTPKWPQWAYYATVLPTSFGYAIFLIVTLIATVSSVDSETMPKATALLYTVRSLGSTLGVSLGGSIQVGALVSELQKRFHGKHGRWVIDAVVHSKGAIRELEGEEVGLALEAYGRSLRAVWIAAGVVAVFTLVAAFGVRQNEMPERPVKRVRGEGVGEGQGEEGRVA